MKKTLTINQQEWKKQVARAKALIRKYEKQGFIFDFEIPKKPKRITSQAIEELKRQTTAPKILSHGVRVVDEVTGETETTRQFVAKKRRAAAKKAAEERKKKRDEKKEPNKKPSDKSLPGGVDFILNTFFDLCDYWASRPRNRNILRTVYDLRTGVEKLIEYYGKQAVAKAIEEISLNQDFGDIILYEGEVKKSLIYMQEILEQIEEGVKNGKKKT